jgi:ClpP class serine protease
LVLFKQFVHENRPNLDIDEVATGETWFGEDAKKRGLTDEIKTADEVLTEYVDNGWDVYEVEYKQPDEAAFAFGGLPGGSNSRGLVGNAARWLIMTLARAVEAELGSSNLGLDQSVSPEKRYMMVDDSADRYRVEHK